MRGWIVSIVDTTLKDLKTVVVQSTSRKIVKKKVEELRTTYEASYPGRYVLRIEAPFVERDS